MRNPTHAGQFLAFLAAQLTGMGVYLFVVWPMTGFGAFSGTSGASPYAGLSALIVFVGAAPAFYALAHDLKALRQGGRFFGHVAAGSLGWFIAAIFAFGLHYYSAPFDVVGNAVVMAMIGALSGAAYWLVTSRKPPFQPR